MDAAEQLAEQMAGAAPSGDYIYLNDWKTPKFGRYKLECQAVKITKKGKPCVEFKVLEAERTPYSQGVHRVGDVVSYQEDIADEQKGGASRMIKALLTLLDMRHEDIQRVEIKTDRGVRELEGKNAQKHYLVKMLNQAKQPCAFLQVYCDVEPNPGKGEAADKTYVKERWSGVEITEADLNGIDQRRIAAGLPSLADAMK